MAAKEENVRQKERRKVTRVTIKHSATISCEGKGVVEGEIENISLRGVFLKAENTAHLIERDEVDLSIVFGEETNEYNINAKARVVRLKSSDGMAFQLGDIDVDSLMNLRQFLSLNIGDG